MKTSPHILVVEDELHLATGIKYNLEAEGYRVTTVKDGPSALRVVEEAIPPVDLVILDLMLPGMSGYAVCESLRNLGNHLPILILSARTLSEDRTRGFDVGANQYMTKPFDLDELLSRVKNLLGQYQKLARRGSDPPASVTSFAFGSARINFDTHEVIVADKPVRMTRLELKLLQYFIEHEGRVITRQQLLEDVWDLPAYTHTRAPDQFIRRLRKIFEPDPAEPRHFLTIRDTGYRFVSQG
ncbi:MAG: response regulator transcription factor [Pirellulaceae bacterium]|nr:response regulator transcription factor [Pirellulaceae bacterium]